MRQLSIRRLHRHAAQFGHRLFWAALPDGAAARDIDGVRQEQQRRHGLGGRAVRTDHLHVTLFDVGDALDEPTPAVIDAVAERASQLVMPQFRIAFDRVLSFHNGAFVLTGDDGLIGVHVLQHRLSDLYDGRPDRARSFTPHVTLLRDGRIVEEQPVERVGWAVKEVVLVHSLLGQTTHRHVARIPLG